MNHKIIILTLIIALISIRCEDEVEPLFSQGTITGKVYVSDTSDPAITKIIAHGPYGNSSTQLNADGKYALSGLGNGTYKIEFQKAGYGRKFLYGVQIFGKDTLSLQNIWLYKMADYNMPELKALFYQSAFSYIDEYSIAFSTDLPPDNTEEVQIRAFISDEEDVSHKNYKHTAQMYNNYYRPGYLEVNANPQVVNSGGQRLFQKGQTLYLIAYVCSNKEEIAEYSDYYGVPIFSTVDEQQHSRIFTYLAP